MLVVVTNCAFLTPNHDLQTKTLFFFREMVSENNNLKLVLITEETSIKLECRTEIKPLL
jgi:hypothetical protein